MSKTNNHQSIKQHLPILAAITTLLEPDPTVLDGARGTVTVAALANAAKMSKNQVRQAIRFWQQFRVLWAYLRAGRDYEIKCQQPIVMQILSLAENPENVYRFIKKHRQVRTRENPWVKKHKIAELIKSFRAPIQSGPNTASSLEVPRE